MSEKFIQVSVRVCKETSDRISKLSTEHMKHGWKSDKATIMRQALERGLAILEKEV